MTCMRCAQAEGWWPQDLFLAQIQHEPQVKTGDTYHIYVDVGTKMLLTGDYGRVCLYKGTELLSSSKSFFLKKDETFSHVFTGTMPDGDLYLNVSLVDEQWYGLTDCADGQSVFIKNGPVTIHITPKDPPKDDKDDTIKDLTKLLMVAIVAMVIAKFI